MEHVDASLIASFLEHLEDGRRNASSTRNIRLAAIRSFFHFLEYREPAALEQIRRILAIPYKKTDSRLVPYLEQEEVQALLDAPSPSRREGIRDRAMLHLAVCAGLRASELTGLHIADVVLPSMSIRIHGGALTPDRARWIAARPRFLLGENPTASLHLWSYNPQRRGFVQPGLSRTQPAPMCHSRGSCARLKPYSLAGQGTNKWVRTCRPSHLGSFDTTYSQSVRFWRLRRRGGWEVQSRKCIFSWAIGTSACLIITAVEGP